MFGSSWCYGKSQVSVFAWLVVMMVLALVLEGQPCSGVEVISLNVNVNDVEFQVHVCKNQVSVTSGRGCLYNDTLTYSTLSWMYIFCYFAQFVMDAVADSLINRYYDEFIASHQGVSIVQYQQLILNTALYIKENACVEGSEVLTTASSCELNVFSEFMDSQNTHLMLNTGASNSNDDQNGDIVTQYRTKDTEMVFMRQGYTDDEVAECFATKHGLTYKLYRQSLSAIGNFRNENTRTFLQKLKSHGFSPRHILDVGANIGEYAASISQLFPDSSVFMIEANSKHEFFLERLCSTTADVNDGESIRLESPRFQYEIAAVSDEVKNVTFHEEQKDPEANQSHHLKATGNSIFKENTPFFDNSVSTTMQTSTIDSIMSKRGITNIDFVKFDIQGGELFALKGARNMLESVEVIQLEMHIAHLNNNAPSFIELHTFMDSIGFSIMDQGQTFRTARPRELLVGMDFYWVRNTSRFWSII